MYIIALIVLVGSGVWLAVAAGAFFALLDFWGEMLWFEAMGYGRRFWEAVWVQVLAGLAGAAVGAAFVYLLTIGVSRSRPLIRIAAVVISGLIGLLQGAANWEIILKFIHREILQSGPAGGTLLHHVGASRIQ